jgi:uncharacterized SAM-binding protein YcdF (DUF218 family)
MTDMETLAGAPGVDLADVAHLVVPGRGRDADGMSLSAESLARVTFAGRVYDELDLAMREGLIVCSGYKTPGDTNGEPWTLDGDAGGKTFVGKPESDSMRDVLLRQGLVPPAAIRVERHSIDTVTNFVRIEADGLFGDGRPVGIVAQESHLRRILDIVAGRTLRRPFIGIVVPETGRKDVDGRMAAIASRAVLLGIRPDTPNAVEITERRAQRAWAVANGIKRLLPGTSAVYHTDVA